MLAPIYRNRGSATPLAALSSPCQETSLPGKNLRSARQYPSALGLEDDGSLAYLPGACIVCVCVCVCVCVRVRVWSGLWCVVCFCVCVCVYVCIVVLCLECSQCV